MHCSRATLKHLNPGKCDLNMQFKVTFQTKCIQVNEDNFFLNSISIHVQSIIYSASLQKGVSKIKSA